MSKYDGFSDRELIALLQKNDEGALRAIYDIHIRQLHYFVLKTAKSRELAEDVVQDVFIKVWDSRLQIDPTQPLKPFLYTIAKRHLLNLLKRIQHESGIIEEIRKYTSGIAHTTDLEMDFEESNALINEAVSKLPGQCRAVFLKCKIQGLSYRQAAEELGITEGTVNSQMVKALKSIRAYINLKNSLAVLLICLSKY
jgi:RNA polymerase sigma-70 factor (ECF subfamily)